MIIFPFSTKLDKGTHDLFAFGNITPEQNPVFVKKIEFSSSSPILIKLIATKELNITDGEDVTAMASNSHIGQPIPPSAIKVIANPIITIDIEEGEDVQGIQIIKQCYGSEYKAADEQDGISIDPSLFMIIRVVTQEKTIVAGNVILQKQRNFYE